ncbi:MAG TPA: hypothetical protein VGC21_00010 [Telluria sp.]|jgi:hypothetical protein
MSNLIKALLAGLLLAGCTTPEQKAANMQAEMEQRMQVYGPACTKLGYAANSDPWRTCVLQLSAREDMDRFNNGYPGYYAGFGRGYWGAGGRWTPGW